MNWAKLGSSDFLKAIRPFVGLFVVLLLFAMDGELRSVIFKGGNFKTILTQTVIVAIGAMGMTMVIVRGGIDLSAGSVVALCSVVPAKLIEHGHGLAAVLALTVLVGGLAGGCWNCWFSFLISRENDLLLRKFVRLGPCPSCYTLRNVLLPTKWCKS